MISDQSILEQDNADVSEHRLGFRGKIALPKSWVQSATSHGFDIQAKRFQNSYTINTANGKDADSVLPMLAHKGCEYTREDLKEALSYLHQPLRHLSLKIANADYEEPDIDDVLDAENEIRLRPQFLAQTQSLASDIDTSVALRLSNTRKAAVEPEAERLHDNLYRAIGFISRASVKEEELLNGGHGDYDDHDDGCEVVAEDMELAEAKKNASETSGLLLEGFGFSRKRGQYRIKIHEDFAAGVFVGEAQKQLHSTLKDSLNAANPDIDWNSRPDRIFLNAIQLERFCETVHARTQGRDAEFEFAIEDVLREEISAEDFDNVDAKAEELENSELLARLAAFTPDAQAGAPRRLAELSTALTILQSLVDNEDMQAIWD